jgi:dimethylaniline monooxygenase (N-oxide forming)
MYSCIQQHQEKNKQQFETLADRVRSLVDYYHYMDSLANLIGCAPPFLRYLILHPLLWFRIVYGATQATQFRLQGPGQKTKLAHEILTELPVSPFNHVVRAGLWGRFIHTLGRMHSREG